MGELLIKPYEISVWEDKLIQDGDETRFVESKLAVIGSDTMTGPNKIYDPVFNKKANGEKSLSFSLKYKYFDPYSDNDEVINPFAALLVNERKIKLHYEDKWYEFVVKDHTESSDEYTWDYTCTDAFVLELSKTGYNITFDAELNNNQGTAEQLTKKTIEDTDWKFGGVDSLKQLVAEPIYKATLVSTSGIDIINATGNSDEIPGAGAQIYLFYSYVKNKNGKYVQFIIRDENRQYTIDDKNVITDTNFRITTELTFNTDGFYFNGNRVISIGEIEEHYQANRLVYSQLTTYDPVMERTVERFKIGDRDIYKYSDYKYTTSNVVTNFITNGDNFNSLQDGSLQGWNPYVDSTNNDGIGKLELATKPELATGKELADITLLSQIEGFLKVNFIGALTTDYKNPIFNDGINSNASFIESIARGDEFVFRWRAGQGELNNLQSVQTLGLVVAKYTRDTPQRWGRYYYHIDRNNIILQIQGTPTELNSIIDGGHIEVIIDDDGNQSESYVIDGVAQTPSTKYLYKHNNSLFYWDGKTSRFNLKDDRYLPYYYLTGTARRAVSNTSLTDVTEKYGIFIYTTQASNQPIYIQDIQFTRCIRDAQGQPVLIGNVPTATSTPVDYYYVKPSDGTAAEDVETYTSIEELQDALDSTDPIEPLYNEGSEKYLSISASQSNCFNILQTIAETFECWIELDVEHDEHGAIAVDENGKPEKYVYLKEYAGKDNWAGFKYGVNIDTIERNINSDEIVTKLIVDDSQSDYVDEGFVSLSNAKANISGESYILNFDYYCNQGLLDREVADVDKTRFIEAVKDINLQIKEKEKERRDLENSLTNLGSKRNVYTELIEAAQDSKTKALADFEELTDQTYEEYRLAHAGLIVPTGSPEQDQANRDKQLTEEETILEILGQLYASSSVINNYAGTLTNIETEYWKVRTQLRGSENYKVSVWVDKDELDQRHVVVELNDYLPEFTFTLNDSTYESTVSKSHFDIITTGTVIVFTPPQGFTINGQSSFTYTINDNKLAKFKIISAETLPGIEDDIDDLIESKKELVKQFNNKYSRFIQEGTWNSTDYIDSELYYLDALQVSNTSAQPTASYTINVVEISQLEGFENYLFDAGDKTYIEDTEFFGWTKKNGVLTPAREEVIVSEVEWHLEEPDKNVITVQNYKTRFEDFFQRVSAAVQTVQYNEATYAKISSLMDANGTLNQDVLLQSLQQIAGKRYELTSDGSVLINGDQILVQNLNNTQNRVIINSEGIRISSDGGATWATAIDGRGINIGTVYTGKLNTDQVIIGSEQNPSFRWDKSGISAYKSNNDQYDLQTYVRYDEYGVYGVKDGGKFKAHSLEDVKEKAHFAVTWDGFFIKNSYTGGGKVQITSDNDFQVINSDQTEKIKIGALEWEQGGVKTTTPIPGVAPSLYGIRINNDNGDTVFKTGDDGNISITGEINATGGNFSNAVTVGRDTTQANKPYIIIDGIDADIRSSNYQDGAGSGWMINADGDATFNNITARGAIKTAVFEYAEIQAVGGVFIFRPSSTIRSAAVSGNDLVLTVEKPILFKDGQWCKVSNYASGSNTSGGEATDPDIRIITNNNGLTHVYQVVRTQGNNEITLVGAKAMVEGAGAVVDSVDDLIGGALVDMGNKAGTSNYGIGINSSDNTVNLPARAISLFETVVDETREPKVTYKYRGILGTLPTMGVNDVSPLYTSYLEGKQGIFTNNMYIGDKDQYIAFYKDAFGNSQLRLVAKSFEILPDDSDLPIDLGDSIVDQKVQYTLSTSDSINTLEEEWSDIPYEVTSGYYQWQRTYVKYAKGRIDYLPSEDGYYMSSEAGQPGPQGPQGPAGEDAVNLVIDSSNGNTFKNSSVNTVLSVIIYKGTIIINNIVHLKEIFGNTAYLQWYWKRIGESDFHPISVDDSMLSNGGFNLTLTPDKVDVKVVFQCEIVTSES